MNAFIDGELTNAEARELQAHVDECSSCSAELSELRKLTGEFHSMGAVSAPPELRSRVTHAVAAVGSGKRPMWRWWPAFALVGVALIAALLFWPRSDAEQVLASADSLIARANSFHMVCKWYRPENRRETFIQRQIWLSGNDERWDEAPAATLVLKGTRVRLMREASETITDAARQVAQQHRFEPMLVNIARLHGRGVTLEHPSPVIWQGHTYDLLVSHYTDKDGSAMRTILMLDPATHELAHGEVQKQQGGRWQTEALMQFEFNKPVDPGVFSL